MQKQKFSVIIRIKPTIEEDRRLYKPPQMDNTLKHNNTLITMTKKSFEQKIYQFNRIFYTQPQQEIFKYSEHLVNEIFEGYNSTFLAYGQTGTGKTHTVFGSKQSILQSTAKHPDAGILYRFAAKIFDEIYKRMHETQFSVRISFMEFYLDNIYDLLASSQNKNNEGKRVDLKETTKDGVMIKDLTQVAVRSYDELVNAIKQAVKARKTQSTTINRNSSRSHALIQITLMQRWNVSVEGEIQTKYRKGILKVVDLAGSERVSKTESEGVRLEEAKRINKQITTLGKCINMLALAEKNTSKSDLSEKFNLNKVHVPFRDCKLSRYLSESLEGKSKIVLCVCVSNFAVHSEETFSSLLFASQAITLKVDAKKNEEFIKSTLLETTQRTNSVQKFETPIKLKLTNRKESKENSTIELDENLVKRLKTEIKLIDDQAMGNFNSVDLQNVDRVHLENAVRVYSTMIMELQNKLEMANRKLAEYERY